MPHRLRRSAAVLGLAVVLAGAIGLGGGSVASSEVRHAVTSTLDRLKELIVGIRTGEPVAPAPLPSSPPGRMDEQTPVAEVRAVVCAARFFKILRDDQTVWQSLRDQGIEPVRASAAPETYYATLDREQAERVEGALTVKPVTSPRVVLGEGNEGMIGTDVFALAWLPTISSDGEWIESSFSFHDGKNGFEILNVSVKDGGIVLVRVRGILPAGEDILILLQVSRTQ